jgi:glycosyltransferase involved in cell wall biosynthesis
LYKISICIPTYNGAEVLGETLDSLIKEIKEYPVEIVINDDKSTDNTLELAKEYTKKYPYISVYQNERNLRMDRNFTATALKAKGEYVWLCGQDDILQFGVVEKAIGIINENDINFIYFNYKFVDDSLRNEVMSPILNLNDDKCYKTMDDYFSEIDQAPSFLPANLMKREFWENTNCEKYFDTYYVQVGVWLENFHKGNIYVVANKEHVLCRVPIESWKYNDGNMIYGTALGNLKVYKIANKNKKISDEVYLFHENRFISRYLKNVIASKAKGLDINNSIIETIGFIFKDNKTKRFYIEYFLYIPKIFAEIIYKFSRLMKGK